MTHESGHNGSFKGSCVYIAMSKLPLINKYIIFFTYLMIPLSILGPGIIIMPEIGPIHLLPHWLFMMVSIPISILLLMKNGFKINLVSVVHIDKHVMFFLLWIFFGYISLSWSSNLEIGFRDAVLFSMVIGNILLILRSWSSLRNVKIAIAWLCFILIVNLCVVFIEVMYDYHLPASGITVNDVVSERRVVYEPGLGGIFTKGLVTGTFYNANALSVFVSIVLPIIFSFYVRSPVQKKYLRVVSFIVMIMGMVLLLYTFTRTVYLALLCVAIYYILISVKKSVIILVLFLAMVLFGSFIVTNISDIAMNLAFYDASVQERTFFYETVINDLFDSFLFLGKGAGAYPFAIHNWYLEIASSFGIYILVLYIIFVFSILKNLYAIYRKTHSIELRYLSEGLLGANIAYSISCVADSGRLLGYDSWIMIAVSLVIINRYRSGHNKLNYTIISA